MSDRQTAPTPDAVRAYYDERVDGKLRDFTHANPRIEAAVGLIAAWAPPSPQRVLEIGCGIGATSWRMARAWPSATVVGTDISGTSIEVAAACFQRPNLRYMAGGLETVAPHGPFDLVVLMDVYEHVPAGERSAFHAILRTLLSDDCRIVVTLPTAEMMRRDRETDPDLLQIVDEEVGVDDILRLASALNTDLLYYRKVGIWKYGDYAHVVFGRFDRFREVPPTSSGVVPAALPLLRRALGDDRPRGYLGPEVLQSPPLPGRWRLTKAARERLASGWGAR